MPEAVPSREAEGRGCLRLVLIYVCSVPLLIVLLYLEEDWRGAHELGQARSHWQAAGYSLKPADYYPPPVPDAENLAALPFFQLEPDPKTSGQFECVKLRDATDQDKHGGLLQNYEKKTDLAALVAQAYTKVFPSKTPPASSFAQLEELYPFINEVRTASSTRTAFRLNQDYAQQPAWDRPLGPVTAQIKVAKFLSWDAELALKENQPQVALDDIKCGFQIARGAGTDPSLVGGLVSLGVSAITRSKIDDGLSKHVWSDTQLTEIQGELKRTDCLSIYQFAMRSEFAVHSLPMFERLKDKPSAMKLLMGMANESQSAGSFLLWYLWAEGWWDMNAAKMANLMLGNVDSVDYKTRLVDAKHNRELQMEVERAKVLPGGMAPWTLLYAVAAGPLTNALEKFAQGQVQLDEDRVVCGLERYRLAHKAYPAALDALLPDCIDELPHDVMNGRPLHYQLNEDGTFVLYSVGWNQVDDGGKIVLNQYNSKALDYTQGDWVWPMVKR